LTENARRDNGLPAAGASKLLKSKKKMEPFAAAGFIIGMGQTASQRTILVVEDEPFIRLSAVAMLEDAGFGVLDAKDSAEALKMLAHHEKVSILMTDVRMPGQMDGLALVAYVRVASPAIFSLVVSANISAAQAGNAGAAGFLAKPYTACTMVQAVNDAVLRH